MWTADTYTVTYNLDGGTQQAGTWTPYTYGVGLTLPTAPTKDYHTFGGWFDNVGLTGEAVTVISTTDTGNKEFWAKWTANTYTVTYNLDGGTQQTGTWTPYTYGVGLTLPTAPTKTGYTFGGWFDNVGLTDSAVTAISTTDTGNKEFWAKWTADTYGITLSETGTHTFTAATYGYAAQTAHTVTVNNTGNQATGALTVALSGDNPTSFTLSTTSISSIAVSGNNIFTVQPNTGLAAGTYTATVTVSGGNGITASFNVSFTVNKANPSVT